MGLEPIVDTTAGKVEGIEAGGVLQFRGMPYAQADRFRPPHPPPPWPGVRDASQFGTVAPQNQSVTEMLLGLRDPVLGEDCLRLNVFTPACDDRRRPVMVWIHGGGFTGGSGHVPHYNGAKLSRTGDAVVVTLNYRLGALGFLRLDEVLEELAGSGMNGLRDQLAALRWVRDNVASFGGDPGRVTIFGESAGAMSVSALMAMPAAAGLFHGAIVQSGTAENLLAPDAAAAVADRLLSRLGLGTRTASKLVDLPFAQILEAQTGVEADLLSTRPDPGRPGPKFLQLPFQPQVDGVLLPHPPLEAVRDGSAAGLPLVAGSNRDEWNLFMLAEGRGELTERRLRRRVERLVGEERAEQAIAVYRDARPEANPTKVWCDMVTDQQFRMPAVRLAEAQLPHGGPVAMYRFDYPSAAFGGLPGACHAIEIPFVFGNVELPGVNLLLGGVDAGTLSLSDRCSRAWVTMAHTGRPHHEEQDWPAYDLERRVTCILDRTSTTVDDPDSELRAFWEET